MPTAESSKVDGWNADRYNKTADFVYSAKFTTAVLNLLQPQSGQHIVDFGCGSGELTKQLSDVVGASGRVVGYDASANMVNKARANGVLDARVADLQVPEFYKQDVEAAAVAPGSFDAVFSNAALHWCKSDPLAVARNAFGLLRPGGRFACEMGGFTNLIGLRSTLHHVMRKRGLDPRTTDPWYFPSAEEHRRVLETAGFVVQEIALHPRLTPLNGDAVDWMEMFVRPSLLKDLSDEDALSIMRETQEMVELDSKDVDGNWAIMYVRLRFKAVKPE
ncbi:S-adenosyl-L-methionine-dependent methyltransferase [Auriculariales sp. MPI-PUGE-AT-0066]|nr:S-adenosyl-L-methionine-dependent methyltransferase [Auriculariales sp. MPI-PUGE-AT-0066]